MSANITAQGGEGQIILFEIISNRENKPTLDPQNGIIQYYENILDKTIRVNITFTDTGYGGKEKRSSIIEAESVRLTAGEFVNLKFGINVGNKLKVLDFTGEKKLRIEEARVIAKTSNKLTINMDLVSPLYYENMKLKRQLIGNYYGKIDNTIKTIFKSLNTEIEVDPTLNELNVRGRRQLPFYVCTWLASRSVPEMPNASKNLAGYFFYQTSDGYKFKSIDKLFQQTPKKKLIHNGIIEASPPPGYDGKIIDGRFDSISNLKNMMRSGAFGKSEEEVIDLCYFNSGKTEFNYKKQFFEDNVAGLEPIKFGDDEEDATVRYWNVKDLGRFAPGNTEQQLKVSTQYINFNTTDIQRQSAVRYNRLFSIKLNITLSADMDLKVGDLIYCDFAEVSGEKLKQVSSTEGGIYMIVALCHLISKNGSFTQLELVRDSIGRKPF